MTRIAAAILLVFLFVIAAFFMNYAEATGMAEGSWRYKMTVEVQTPEGLKSGFAVREIKVDIPVKQELREYGKAIRVTGEAVVIDLGKRGTLFALLGGDYAYEIVFEAFPGPPGLSPAGIKYYSHLKDKKAVLDPGVLRKPEFVIFTNPSDPKTVMPIVPSKLSSYFGEGVFIKQITIETTKEPITQILDRYAPDFDKDPAFLEWFRKLPYGDSRRIGPDDFKRGL